MKWNWFNEILSNKSFENFMEYSIDLKENEVFPIEFSISNVESTELAFEGDKTLYLYYLDTLSEQSKRIINELKFDIILKKLFNDNIIQNLYVNFVDYELYNQVKSQYLDIINVNLTDEKAEILSRIINLNKLDFNLVKREEDYRLYFKHCDLKSISALIYIVTN